jgi:hypothetical protein
MGMTVRPIQQSDQYSLTGECPHCERPSSFQIVTAPHIEQPTSSSSRINVWALLQCQACGKYICGCVTKSARNAADATYVTHYPLGKPSDSVAQEIPEHIASDFSEALRCRWVNAHNATAEMCRRAVQASCIHLEAPSDKKLVAQIDWLAVNGKITTPLKEMAHRVRLGGNLGAHPPDDPEDESAIIMGAEYADAVVEFTRDFFHHVYVMPERLKKFTFRK